MNKYELMTIANKSLGEDGARTLSNSVKDQIGTLNGKILDSDFWGKRKFAYEIKHDHEGFYDVVSFELAPLKVQSFKEKLNLMSGLTRYLIVQDA